MHFSVFCRRAAWLALVMFAPAQAANELSRDPAKLYGQYCASCHGEALDGGAGGSLVDGMWRRGAGDDAHVTRLITNGEPESGMPGFGAVLDAPRIRALVVYLRERAADFEARARVAANPVSAGPMPPGRTAEYRIQTLVTDLSVPWSLAFLPGAPGMLIAERDGRLLRWQDGAPAPVLIPGTPSVWAQGQGGLLVVQAHPNYAQEGNGWLYLAYSAPGENREQSMTAIVRGRIRDGRWVDEQEIYRASREHYLHGGVHFGTRLVFDSGYVYFGIGDRGAKEHAQDLARPNGKIHRIHDDGRVPADNPFVAIPGALPTIWSYGHRNPQGIGARPGTTGEALEIWATEHGPRGGDELNRVRRGANYGWPLITHGINYDGTPITAETARPGLESPVLHWTPSIAVCGLEFYVGERFPGWKGDLLVGALRSQEVLRLTLDGASVTRQEVLFRGQGRVRAVQVGPDGLVYICLEGPGRVVRLAPLD